MKTTRLMTVGGVLGVTVLCGAVPAAAVPPQAVRSTEILAGTDRAGGDGYCPFDVRLDITDNQRSVFTNLEDGSVALRFSGAAFVTVTNVESGESIDLNVSGPGDAVFRPDGSFTGDVKGLNLLRTTLANSAPGVPQLNYTRGRATFAVAPGGKTTSFQLQGLSTDICALLS